MIALIANLAVTGALIYMLQEMIRHKSPKNLCLRAKNRATLLALRFAISVAAASALLVALDSIGLAMYTPGTTRVIETIYHASLAVMLIWVCISHKLNGYFSE